MNEKTYIAIDLKSFYASVECIERKLNPMTTNLVVADEGRTEKTIGLAVSPSLKSFGIPGRPRLFEVVQKVKEVNNERKRKAGKLTGEISYLTCKEIHSFGNVACLLQVTGQQLLDALEWGVSKLVADGSTESGAMLHVSGLRYTVDLSYASTVQSDDNGTWAGSPTGAYRVKDVQILNRQTGEYEQLDLTRTYNTAGYNYNLRNHGDGFAMFDDAVCVVDYVLEDYMVLAKYIQSFSVDESTGLPTIKKDSGYEDVYGSGRITILNGD